MKKNPATYLVALLALFTTVSCMNDDEVTVVPSPYAMITSFGLGNIKSSYPAFTSKGEDTTVVRTISGYNYPFTINQETGEIFNADSMPYGTNVSKVLMSISLKGVASLYNDSTSLYEYFSTSDSIDFSTPRKFRVTSADAQYSRDYTVTVNVHKVEPELLVWEKYSAPEGFVPACAVELGGNMCLLGNDSAGSLAVAVSPVAGTPEWAVSPVNGLPLTANVQNVVQFGGSLYAVADGSIYVSANAADWAVASSEAGAVAIVGASDIDGRMWIAGEEGIKYSTNGSDFVFAEPLPANFPLYGISAASSPLAHNSGIIRYTLVGYATPDKNGKVYVWSLLSNENSWVSYDNGNDFPCPSLENLTVLRYDNKLFALGGSGVVAGETIAPFSKFFVSRDNGIVWKAWDNYYHRLPKELLNDGNAFASTVDSGNYIWIVNSGRNAGVWKGIINRLGFENKY